MSVYISEMNCDAHYFHKQGRGTYTSFYILSVLFCCQPGRQNRQFCKFFFFFFFLIIIRFGLLAEIRWSVCMSKLHRRLCVSFSRTGAGLCIYHLLVWSIYCPFSSGSPCRPSRVLFYIPPELICCIRLLCDWSFHLCHRIAYICYFSFSLMYSRFDMIGSYGIVRRIMGEEGSTHWPSRL